LENLGNQLSEQPILQYIVIYIWTFLALRLAKYHVIFFYNFRQFAAP